MRLKWWGKEPVYSIRTPRYGESHIPPAVWRKYDQLERAMLEDDLTSIHRLQLSLVHSGFQAPTKVSEIDSCRDALRRQQKRFEKGLR